MHDLLICLEKDGNNIIWFFQVEYITNSNIIESFF